MGTEAYTDVHTDIHMKVMTRNLMCQSHAEMVIYNNCEIVQQHVLMCKIINTLKCLISIRNCRHKLKLHI